MIGIAVTKFNIARDLMLNTKMNIKSTAMPE